MLYALDNLPAASMPLALYRVAALSFPAFVVRKPLDVLAIPLGHAFRHGFLFR